MNPASAAIASLRMVPETIDFRDLFEHEFDYVCFALRRLGVSERDLEDVTHDVFVRVYLQLEQYDPVRPLRPWLFGFAYRTASEYRRLARHRVEALRDTSDLPDSAPSAADHLETRQALELASSALSELDLDRRAVFILHEIEAVAMPQVAEGLGIPLNTAYSRLRLAREQFARAVKKIRARRGVK
ncbi:MAG TPA: RNA polymerase sigma factor [Polyangiaceae bacterium]